METEEIGCIFYDGRKECFVGGGGGGREEVLSVQYDVSCNILYKLVLASLCPRVGIRMESLEIC